MEKASRITRPICSALKKSHGRKRGFWTLVDGGGEKGRIK